QVAFQHDLRYTTVFQQGMIKRFLPWALYLKYLVRKIHEVPEIMYASAWYQVIPTTKAQTAGEVFQQTGIHFPVINKPYRLAFAAVFQTLLNFFHQAGGNIIVDIKFRITGHFKHMCEELIITEIGKYPG